VVAKETVFCRHCGNRLPAGVKFCNKCGQQR
jgi:ribosomal protein L40E